jgi:hypothetical protein
MQGAVMHARAPLFTALSLSAAMAASEAVADVTISSDATRNMSCSSGVCAPTATKAVLNVGDLENLLASGSVEVTTTGSGVEANNLNVTSPFTWTASSALTFEAYQSINFTARVSDGGAGGVSLVSNIQGDENGLSFLPGGSLSFANSQAALSLNGQEYRLEPTLKSLIDDIAAQPDGDFALANDFDARHERAYSASPISVPFGGLFTGLGNTISRLDIDDESDAYVGLFANVTESGSLSSLRLENVVVRAAGSQSAAGAMVGLNSGGVINSSSSGKIQGISAGGLVGANEGVVAQSSSAVSVSGNSFLGGLVGDNFAGADINDSFATGRVTSKSDNEDTYVGGLVGADFGGISNSYATGNTDNPPGPVGGLVGFINGTGGGVVTSYATGAPKGGTAGGFIGLVENGGPAEICYWDTTTSKTKRGVGDGNDAGITGLSTQQLQAGLPAGFDPTIWAEDSKINNGLPYLINNPPEK